MEFSAAFILNSILFGFGLAMDAFSVSVANGLRETGISAGRVVTVAGTFGAFQTAMQLIGWVCVRTIAETFQAFQRFIPWIALALLLYIGIKMIHEGVRGQEETESLHGRGLILQGVATSIDALSVGFAIEEYSFPLALTEALIIGIVTFGLCSAGLYFGRKIGSRFSGKATVAGGIILILIGLEIWITGIT